MRFASVYKDFQEITDFERELGVLLAEEGAREAPTPRRRTTRVSSADGVEILDVVGRQASCHNRLDSRRRGSMHAGARITRL